jgi:hypothetical protein
MIARERGGVLGRRVGAPRPVVGDEDQLVGGLGGLELLVERADDMRQLRLCAVAEDDDRKLGCVPGGQGGASIRRARYAGRPAT